MKLFGLLHQQYLVETNTSWKMTHYESWKDGKAATILGGYIFAIIGKVNI